MDFRLSEDQLSLRATVRDFLDGEHGPERLRALDRAGGRDEDLRRELVAMGLTGILVPEAQGGLGLGLVEAALVAVELGRACVSEPIADTGLVAARLLAGDDPRLSAIAAGGLRIALAHPVNPWIADLDTADLILDGSGVLERSDETVPLESIDPLRRLFSPPRPPQPDDRMLDLAALMSAAQLLGAAERMLSLSTDYAQTRSQFGQPIGAFQAVKHLLATVAVRNAFVHPVLLRAAYATEHGHEGAPVHISHAKLAATDAAMLAAETAIQVHGAMGYTYEVDLHYWMKRSWALAGAWGDRAFHLRRIDAAVIGGGMETGPDMTFANGTDDA